jgi:ferritin-like metal-binding protein YciE
MDMAASEQKIVQYLNEAHASEVALTRVLESQIAMTPRGTFRSGLETHHKETRDHAKRIEKRLGELDQGGNPLMAVLGAAETVVGQMLALTKTPMDLLRGTGGEEKVLKNAKDACATEALEIATYTALERLASDVGDTKTEQLAASIRADEEKMLKLLLREIPKLTDAVVGADVKGNPTYDVKKTGAADTARKAANDKLTADDITSRLTDLSQIDLAKVHAYERKNQNRTTVIARIDTLRGDEPWAGYDELTAAEVQSALSAGDDSLAKKVRTYERAHKDRAGVIQAAERETTNA